LYLPLTWFCRSSRTFFLTSQTATYWTSSAAEEGAHVAAALVAQADAGHDDPVAWRGPAVVAQAEAGIR
jgi:hypothetical protein